jgi:GpV Apex motif
MAVESIKLRVNSLAPKDDNIQLRILYESLRVDLEALRVQLNTHVHSGITAGGANTAVPTTTIASLNTQA